MLIHLLISFAAALASQYLIKLKVFFQGKFVIFLLKIRSFYPTVDISSLI